MLILSGALLELQQNVVRLLIIMIQRNKFKFRNEIIFKFCALNFLEIRDNHGGDMTSLNILF